MTVLSIVIVNYRGWQPLSNLLSALVSMPQTTISFETIVVDNRSNDGEFADFSTQFPTIKFIENTGNHGFAHGCNTGARNAVSPLLLFLNPDTNPTHEALLELIATYGNSTKKFAVLSCRQSLRKTVRPLVFPTLLTLTGWQRSIYRLFNKNKIQQKKCDANGIARPDWVSGSVVLISREWFDTIGGWDEDFWMYSEDVDLSKRVTDAGGKIGFLCDTYIEHAHGGTSRTNVETEALTKTEVLKSQHIYIEKHFSTTDAFVAHILLIISNLLGKMVLGFLGIVLFFMPKLRVQTLILQQLLAYYFSAVSRKTWVSQRSVNG